jgi:AbrB family looped-hinge helix DNA binding protein
MLQGKARLSASGRLVIPAAVRKALGLEPGDELILRVEDGELRLSTRRHALARARRMIRQYMDFLKARPLALRLDPKAGADRYGRLPALVENAKGEGLQEMLLRAGLAQLMVEPAADAEIEPLLAAERAARLAGDGLWAEGSHPAYALRRADELDDATGSYRLVRGEVRRVSVNRRYVYINFGADWRTDLTLRMERTLAERSGLEAAALEGREVLARGVVEAAGGPLLALDDPRQMEILP